MRVAFCASEIFPFAKTGGLADVCGALPRYLKNHGVEVSLFIPLYRSIKELGLPLEKKGEHYAHTVHDGIDVFFVVHAGYFDRDGLYGDSKGDYSDNLERFQYFCRTVLDILKKDDLSTDLIHCHDWQTALIPVYLKENYRKYRQLKKTKTMLTIHNLAYQGVFPKESFSKLELDQDLYSEKGFEFYDQLNLLKAGILFSDCVTTVSPQYAREIQTEEFGCGLDQALKSKKGDLVGIINGLDYQIWNPQNDAYINRVYSVEKFTEAKLENKFHLQKQTDLPIGDNVPVLGMVSRLSHQKGVDLIIEALDEMMRLNIQVIIQGVGDQKYCQPLVDKMIEYPQKLFVYFEFDERLAHQIYAGSDFFLMPSNFEPCGLSQMIAMAYGTIPIVYKTGGLADTVIPFDLEDGEGNGIVFDEYTKNGFLNSVKQAAELYQNKEKFRMLIHNAFRSLFLWYDSAQKYIELYEKC